MVGEYHGNDARVSSPTVEIDQPGDSDVRRLFREPSVIAVLAAQIASATASALLAIGVGKQVYDMTKNPFDLGLIGLAEFLPAMFLVLVTGSVADRFDRRKVSALALAGELVFILGLIAYVRTNPTAPGPIFVLLVGFGATRAFVAPAMRSLPPMVAPTGTLPRLVAFSSATWQVAAIVGPVMAGLLYTVGRTLPFVAAAFFIALAMIAVLTVRLRNVQPSTRGERPSLRLAMEGLRFVRTNPILFGAISLDLFAVLFGGAVALLPAIADQRLGVGAVGLGWLRAAGGIGASLTAAALAVKPIRRRVGKVLLVTIALFGVATVGLGLTRSYVVAFAAMFVLNAADMISVFIRGTIVPLSTPNHMRGRVLAVENVFIGASNELGGFESGTAARIMGTTLAVVTGGLATVAIVIGWWWFFPALRNIDTFDELETPDEP